MRVSTHAQKRLHLMSFRYLVLLFLISCTPAWYSQAKSPLRGDEETLRTKAWQLAQNGIREEWVQEDWERLVEKLKNDTVILHTKNVEHFQDACQFSPALYNFKTCQENFGQPVCAAGCVYIGGSPFKSGDNKYVIVISGYGDTLDYRATLIHELGHIVHAELNNKMRGALDNLHQHPQLWIEVERQIGVRGNP